MSKRHTLWVGFVAVLVPLTILLALQFRWLRELDGFSERAHKAQVESLLEAVSKHVEYFYTDAGQILDLQPSVFTQNQLDRAAKLFKKRGVVGVERLFVMKLRGGGDRGDGSDEEPLYFSPSCAPFLQPDSSPEARAISVAIAPWKALHHKDGILERVRLFVEEKDPNFRILLYPVTDDSSRLVGLAGMVLDEGYFRSRVLPAAIRAALSDFAASGESKPIIAVEDGQGRLVYATRPLEDGDPWTTEARRPFGFVFTDWNVALATRQVTAAEVARRNFLLNFGLSAALAAVLLGGLVLALRIASREMKLSQMKNEFVSNVSHELRTPLASIRVFGEFLRLGRFGGTEKAREYGDYIETESRRLTQLIDNILDFASIESGRKTYRFERCDVREVVCETLKTFEVRLRQTGFNVRLEGSAVPLPPAWIDAGAIARSLSNLLDNAVKYSRHAGDITVSLRREGEFIVISVRDQGIGIPRDEQRKIFDRFHRVSTGLVHDVKGSGLGLAIVHHIVEAHHGTVTVESRTDEGSTFSLHLPIETPEPTPLAATAGPREQPSEA
ncbi:MAG TPA: HAMP domain-containing sensor histidine kinase [Thermoanaerobaculia bacterium]